MKDKFAFVSDPETLAAIERDDFHSPILAAITPAGCWVYAWSLEQYREQKAKSSVASVDHASHLDAHVGQVQ